MDITLDEFVDWDVPTEVLIAPASILGAMKVRAVPQRDKSHKLLKDLADLHALLWYVTDYEEIRMAIRGRLKEEDVTRFASIATDDLYGRTARLIDIDPAIVQQSITGLVEG